MNETLRLHHVLLLLFFVLGIGLLALYAGSPASPKMPGVVYPAAPVITAPVQSAPAAVPAVAPAEKPAETTTDEWK